MLLTYDGFALPYSHLTNYDQESVFDPSNTDRIVTKFAFRVQCLLNTNYLALIQPGAATLGAFAASANAATLVAALRGKLLAPRRSLSVKVNGQELIPAPTGGPGTVDCMNGPQPKFCNVVRATAETFLVDYAVEASYVENLRTPADRTTNFQGPAILYNRWSEEVDIDEAGYSRRTRSGKFVIRTDNEGGYIPDELRSVFAVLSVPDGFVRQSAKYTQDPNGTDLSYEIVDREIFKFPPPGAMQAEGKYREIAQGFNACLRFAEVDVKLTGARGKIQAELVATALAIAQRKLEYGGAGEAGTDGNRGIPQNIVAEVDMYKNEVRVRVLTRLQGFKRNRGSLNLIRTKMTLTPLSAGGGSQPEYQDRGSAGLLLQAAAYFDPTLQNAKLSPSSDRAAANPDTPDGADALQMNTGLSPGEAGNRKEG